MGTLEAFEEDYIIGVDRKSRLQHFNKEWYGNLITMFQ
jgi:hypothetical protein